jgi:ribonuclease P protein component
VAGLSFPARLKLKTTPEFQAVYTAKCSTADGRLIVYALPNGMPESRVGLSVSKKVGNAVVRNRVKRMLREAFRLARSSLPMGFDFVLIPRNDALKPTIDEWMQSLVALSGRSAKKANRTTHVLDGGASPADSTGLAPPSNEI